MSQQLSKWNRRKQAEQTDRQAQIFSKSTSEPIGTTKCGSFPSTSGIVQTLLYPRTTNVVGYRDLMYMSYVYSLDQFLSQNGTLVAI